MAKFEVVFRLSDSITVQVTGLDTSFINNRDFDFYIDDQLKGSVNNVSPTEELVGYTYEGLKPETSYDLKVVILWAGTDTKIATFTLDDVHTLEEPEEPDPKPDPPKKWSWVNSNGSATSSQVSNAYTALTTKGKCSDVSYKVWNDMCSKVLEVLEYNDNEWSDTYLSFSNTKMSSDDKVMTANRFNSLSLNVMSATGSSSFTDVSKGGPVKGSYFTDLMNIINGYIDYLNNL